MSLTVPVAGDDIDATWGEGVTLLNLGTVLVSDVTANPAAFADLTGLTFPVVDTYAYQWELFLFYSTANVNTGLSVGFNHPGGTAHQLFEIFGEATGPTTLSARQWDSAVDTNSGSSNVFNNGTYYLCKTFGHYACTANGTFAIRWKRNATSANITARAGSALLVRGVKP